MPELPDVEAFRRIASSCGKGRRIEKVQVVDAGVLRGVSARRLRGELEGRTLAAPGREGKWLIAPTLGGPTVLLHFGMTGQLLCSPSHEPPHRHDRVRLHLDSGHVLGYRDQRKLQGLRLAASRADVDRTLAAQGPDALSVDAATLRELLDRHHRARVKAVLMDQSVLAGLGNLLADEILWRARIHPTHSAGTLAHGDHRRLYSAMRRVLADSVRAGCVPGRPSWLTGHREGAAQACPRCGTPLDRGKVGGRTTVWCPHCQPPPGGE